VVPRIWTCKGLPILDKPVFMPACGSSFPPVEAGKSRPADARQPPLAPVPVFRYTARLTGRPTDYILGA
jgi:hypothetical protein